VRELLSATAASLFSPRTGTRVRAPKADPRAAERRRFYWVGVAFAAVCSLVVVKLVSLQVVSPDRLLELGTNQRTRAEELLGQRGTLVDRNGVDLALSVPLRRLIVNPSMVADPSAAAEIVSGILPDVDSEALRKKLSTPNSKFAYVERQIPPDTAKEVLRRLDRAGVEGFYTEAEFIRMKTAEGVAAGLIGEVDVDGRGTSGLEQLLDTQLRGEAGRKIVDRAQDGGTIANSERVLTPATAGADVGLTIDRQLQFEVEQALIKGVDETGAAGGVAIVGDPLTGDLLAVANVRRNKETDKIETSAYNMAFAMAVEPGSVIKMVTASAAYNENLATPTEVIAVPSAVKVGDHRYTDHDPHGVEAWSVSDILAHSSNVGTIMLSKRAGKERMETYLRRFGFGRRTVLSLPGESAGILRPSRDWASTDRASISIGQGIATTPIQLWSAYNVIANSGKYVAPRIVDWIDRPSAEVEKAPASVAEQVVRPEVATWVSRGLQQVVSDGTASGLKIPGYSMAGKTGTAYKPNPKTGDYDWGGNRRYTATFSGFLPASAPQVSITVVIDEPTGAHTGASAAAPVFESAAEISIRHLGIPADQPFTTDASAKPVRATPALPGPAPEATATEEAATDETAGKETAGKETATEETGGANGSGDTGAADNGGTSEDGDAGSTDSAAGSNSWLDRLGRIPSLSAGDGGGNA
jgi:cell division protein FtsI (penicillin-binding protein 3)